MKKIKIKGADTYSEAKFSGDTSDTISVKDVRRAVKAQDETAAVAATTKTFNDCNKINWFQIQYERARSELRVAQMYIQSQEGILDIWYNELKAAKAEADAKDILTTQPAAK